MHIKVISVFFFFVLSFHFHFNFVPINYIVLLINCQMKGKCGTSWWNFTACHSAAIYQYIFGVLKVNSICVRTVPRGWYAHIVDQNPIAVVKLEVALWAI